MKKILRGSSVLVFGLLLILGCGDDDCIQEQPHGDVGQKCYEVAFSAGAAMEREGYEWEIWNAPCPEEWHTECRAKINGRWLWVRDGWWGWWLEFAEQPVCKMDLSHPDAQMWNDLPAYGHMVNYWANR